MSVWSLQPPEWWPALLLLPAFLMLGYWLSMRRLFSLQQELGRRELAIMGARRFDRARLILAVASVAAFGVALLRPVQPGREAELAPDVVLCIDVSRSMGAADAEPTRFEAMRQQVKILLDSGIGSRFALLAFANDVKAIAPLTADRDAVAWLLDELAPGAIAASGGTNIGAAIKAADATFARTSSKGELVLLTDGEDFASDAEALARLAQEHGHRVHCIGYGTAAGSKIVIERDGAQTYLQDQSGNDVITRLDVGGLAGISAAGGGSFLQPTRTSDLLDLWRTDFLPFSAKRQLAASETDVIHQFRWPLLIGLLLLMLRMSLPERSR